MSERSEAFGRGFRFDWNGKTYTMGLITHGLMTAIEQHLFQQELDRLARLKPHLSAEQYDERIDALEARDRSGEFAFEGKAARSYLETVQGMVHILSLMLQATGDEVLAMLQTDGERVNELLKQAIRQSYPAGKSPKAKARTSR